MNDFFDFTQDPAWCRGKFPGLWTINGRIEEIACSIFMAGCSLSISDKDSQEQAHSQHRSIGLYPFDRGMIANHDATRLKNGSFFEVAGSQVGMFSEGRSAPYGEGEFVCRPIRRFRVETSYRCAGIGVKISGQADAAPEDSGSVEAWVLAVEFSVPRPEFQSFFAFNDLGMRTYDEVYGRHVKGA